MDLQWGYRRSRIVPLRVVLTWHQEREGEDWRPSRQGSWEGRRPFRVCTWLSFFPCTIPIGQELGW